MIGFWSRNISSSFFAISASWHHNCIKQREYHMGVCYYILKILKKFYKIIQSEALPRIVSLLYNSFNINNIQQPWMPYSDYYIQGNMQWILFPLVTVSQKNRRQFWFSLTSKHSSVLEAVKWCDVCSIHATCDIPESFASFLRSQSKIKGWRCDCLVWISLGFHLEIISHVWLWLLILFQWWEWRGNVCRWWKWWTPWEGQK